MKRRKIRWLTHLWQEWTAQSWRRILKPVMKPAPLLWQDTDLTAAWLGHATVLINFFGVTVLTDPVFSRRIGIRVPFLTIGPKRLTAPALVFSELPRIDLVLVTHAHFDHLDRPTLRRFGPHTQAITARETADLFRGTRFAKVHELDWGKKVAIGRALEIEAFRPEHWGARVQWDTSRGYNSYILRRAGHSLLVGGDSAPTDAFARQRAGGPFDLAIMNIGAYDPWIRAHATPEQAIAMATDAGARFIIPVHHQTFRLSVEPFREPIERFERALAQSPDRIALREIGETFVLPPRA